MARDLVLEVIEQVRGNALGDAARDLEGLAKKTDTASGSAKNYTGSLKTLDAQIEQTRSKIRTLGVEFVATQEKTVSTDLRAQRGLLRQLERIRKELTDAGAEAGASFGAGFLTKLGALPSQARGLLLVAGVGVGAALAPVIGAAVSGAVVGAVGAGGIAGGIAAASRDPNVRAAATDFSEAISAEFFSGGGAFVGPTIEALGILQQAFDDLDLGDSWQRVAPYVTQVASGIAGMAERFMPGFNRALDAAGPALSILAQELPEIGDALSDMLTDISESEGTLEGWAYTLEFVESAIRATGQILGWLGDRFHDMVRFAAFMSGVLEDIPLPQFGDRMRDINDKFEQILSSSERATGGIEQHASATRNLNRQYEQLLATYSEHLGIAMSVDQANQQVFEGLLRLKAELKENGKDWRTTTEAGLANRDALISQVQALIRQRQANIDARMSAEEATARFEAELHALEQLAIKAGISKQALDDLVGDYHVNIVYSSTGADTYSRALARALTGRDSLSGFAHGGNPPIGEPFWVGEAGKELMMLTPRPQVFSHQQSKAMAGQAADTARQTSQALTEVLNLLREIKERPAVQINVNAPETMSPRELSAVVARELAWAN